MSDTSKQLTLTADFLTARERREFAPFAARTDRTRGRRYDEKEHSYRSPYMRDRDRIIHATAFRRLEYKTQVFVNHEGDYYRTRLTHTIEVAQIARILARVLRVNEDLTEAIALAHDIGHTPFGHSGEDALDALMADDGGFEHNLHGLRVVDLLEQNYPDVPGLNLTYEVREGIAKHHTSHDHPATPGADFDLSERSLIEAQLVDVADVIAYDSHDIDDGLKSGLLDERELEEVAFWREARQAVQNRWGDLPEDVRRSQIVRQIINIAVTDVLEATELNIAWLKLVDAESIRRLQDNVVTFSDRLGKLQKELETFLMDRLYRHPRVHRMTVKARSFLTDIFNAYVSDVRQLPRKYQESIDAEEKALSAHRTDSTAPDDAARRTLRARAARRIVCDYVAGMTDRYAQETYLTLFTPGERV
ncbi:MAG TPA: deoxyguanosinetriphosphate triphosphohydrolase [Planctomycetota bacterium]|nr:deoxyguanosinetriphosphate triphosphohydrolase [Planctomycetota bacterium]